MSNSNPPILHISAIDTYGNAAMLVLEMTEGYIESLKRSQASFNDAYADNGDLLEMRYYCMGIVARSFENLPSLLSEEDRERYRAGQFTDEPMFPLDHGDNMSQGFATFTADQYGVFFTFTEKHSDVSYGSYTVSWKDLYAVLNKE